MPIAKLVFDLTDTDENEYFKYARTGLAVRLAVCDFDRRLRDIWKYGDDKPLPASEVRRMLCDAFDDHCVDFEVF